MGNSHSAKPKRKGKAGLYLHVVPFAPGSCFGNGELVSMLSSLRIPGFRFSFLCTGTHRLTPFFRENSMETGAISDNNVAALQPGSVVHHCQAFIAVRTIARSPEK